MLQLSENCAKPNTDNVVKLAIHHAGYTYGLAVSTPRTVISHPEDGLRIPKEMVVRLRQGLKSVYPGLAKKAFIEVRWHLNVNGRSFMLRGIDKNVLVWFIAPICQSIRSAC